MPKAIPISVEKLWQLDRLGAPSLSPDGAQAVLSVTHYSMHDNKGVSTLWLLSTLGGQARTLTTAGDKDGQPQWSPQGDLIAFTAKREQEGSKDDETQLYVIAPDGGEARRVGTVATGVGAYRWCPDGKHVVFISWVWPDLGASGTGAAAAKAQAKKLKEFKTRKETGYVTSEAQYRYWDHHLPMGRVARLHTLNVGTGQVRDLFEGTHFELTRTDPDALQFDIAADGKRLVFSFDPNQEKRIGNCFALAEMDIATRRIRVIVQDSDWDCGAPRYSSDGARIAFIASHQGAKHTMPAQLAVWQRKSQDWQVVSGEWDHEVQGPLRWEDGNGEDERMTLLFTAQQEGRQHLWRFDIANRSAAVVSRGGWVQAFDKQAGVVVTLADSIEHPARIHAQLAERPAQRIETFNDEQLSSVQFGRSEELWFKGAASTPGGKAERVQMWLTYPPGFDGKSKAPLMQLIHGGPHTAFGDAWHWRWNVQAMAAQGYVVACVNYHGSSSFGHAFLDSITHRWGALELQDIEAATTLLLKKPWADRKRVFATGGSYGGYMVAWMNGHVKPGRYAAYVCHAGCFDWTAMFADDAYTWHAKELGAWYWDDMARIHSQSPHVFAAAMKTPTLVIHGALDYRVPDAQGLAYYNTLKALGVDARLLWYPDENHWILKPRNSRQWYREFFDWLRAHDAGAATKPATKKAKSDRR